MFDSVKSLFDYNNGHLIYKIRQGSRGSVGNIAGSLNPTDGRWYVKINGVKYSSYRIIFLWHKGFLPEEVDHIDRDITNNRIENLREADRSLNNCNKGDYKNNKLGIKGVCFVASKQKYQAQVYKNKVCYRKFFEDLDSAKEWVIIMRNKLHNNSDKVHASKGV